MIDQDHWTTIAKGLSLGTLKELHEKIREAAAVAALPADFVKQSRIFEAELARRGEAYVAIAFR
jgi:hypothetical protein